LGEDHWNDIAAFIVCPDAPVPGKEADKKDRIARLLGLFPPVLWSFLIAVVIRLGVLLWVRLPNDIIRTAGLILYARIIWKILTRF
jgi:hypothetical protein